MLAAAARAPEAPNPIHDLIHALIPLWPLWAAVGAVGVGRALLHLWKVGRLRRAGIVEIDRMDGPTFERRLAVLFRSLGYRAEVVGRAGGDYGADLVVSKRGVKSVVQAKCWRQNVGVKAVQEATGARGFYDADSAFVVTNRRFTRQARELARKNKVELWGRDELVAALLKTRRVGRGEPVSATSVAPRAEPAPLAAEAVATAAVSSSEVAPAVDVSPAPSAAVSSQQAFCARCGEPVSAKVRDYCLADQGRFGGLVYCYRDQRAFRRSRGGQR